MTQWIISSGVLIAVVIALRFALRGKISLRLQYALWLLVLVRLLIPMSFGTSDLSVMNAVPDRLPSIQQSVTIPTENVVTPAAPFVPAQGIDAPLPSDFAQNTTAADTTPKAEKTDWAGIARTGWLSGVAVLGLTFLVSNLRFGRKLRRSRRSIENTGTRLPVYESAETETPCLFGLLKPSIYVTPDACADADTLRYALAHEQTHYRHGDHLWAVLRGVCLALHWYNPLVWWAAELSRRDAELACDEATIHALGETERAAYGRTLIRMTCEQRPALLVTATMMTDSGKGLRERITLLVKKPKTAVCTAVAVLLVAGISVACTFTGGRDSERPYIFENAPVESITLFNSLTGESATYFDKTDAPEIEEIMSMLTMLRQGRSIPQPPPGSTELSICVVYQDGRTVNCGNDSFSSGGKTYQVLITPEAASSSLSVWSWESLWESYCPKTVWQSDFLRWCGRFRGENATNLSISVDGAAALGYTGETLKSMASELEPRLRALTAEQRVQLPDADAFDSAICLVIGDNKDEYMINLSADGNYANTLHVLGDLRADEEGKYFRPEAYYDAPWIASWIRAKAIPLLEGDLPEAVLPIEEETHEEDGVSQTIKSIQGEFPGGTRLTVGTFELSNGAVTFSGAWSPSYASVCAIVKPSKGDGAVVYFKPGESVSLGFERSGSCDIVLLAPEEGIDGTMQLAMPQISTALPASETDGSAASSHDEQAAQYIKHAFSHGNTSTPEFFNDIGRTLSELKNEYPEGEFIVKPDGFPGHAAVCFGVPKAEYLYYFFGTQGGDAEKAMRECEDRLQCAGFVTTASVLFPDMEADLPFEDFFSLIGVEDYEYFSGEDVITAQGWLRFTYHGMEVMVNTNEATTGGGWKFTGDKIVKRTAPVSIVDLGILNTNQDLAEPVMFD